MALDETTEALFRAADTSILLALLPLLQSQIEQTSTEMRRTGGQRKDFADADAEITEMYSEALASLHVKLGDDPDANKALRDLRDKVNDSLGRLREGDGKFARQFEALLGYLADLKQRELWVLIELKRRGYLPWLPWEGRLYREDA
ncbi:hypothetical protein [Actinomadura harenae]|uniref:Uncharacterized protein n=1 Tax=Actinomadura harenae TaxID=2483351 RepID=A0A3M2LL02_9ACTN|nr:hypothetical protein [Actinomadura harenae]RMI38071.1 hypothetical protein EBO15_34145 [Actinomadura harenae]